MRMEMDKDRLKAMRSEHPEDIPVSVGFLPAAWMRHREALEEIVLHHPSIFGVYKAGSTDFEAAQGTYALGEHMDEWGCVWTNIAAGSEAFVTRHPLRMSSARETAPRALWGTDEFWDRTGGAGTRLGEAGAMGHTVKDEGMGNLLLTILAFAGYVLALLCALLAYRLGVAVGSRRAHRLWTEWTGIRPAELHTRAFDRELRHLRRAIGRQADPWPEQGRED